jgi:hypothetical protein
MYSMQRFGAEVLIDAVRTHPKVLVGTTVFENPYYLTPEEFTVIRRSGSEQAPPTGQQVAELFAVE